MDAGTPQYTCDSLFELASNLGTEAAKNDTWMEVSTDTMPNYSNIGDFMTAEQQRWTDTTHFDVLYGAKITDALNSYLDWLGENNEDEMFCELQHALISEFFEAWFDAHEVDKLWKKSRK